LAKWLLDSLPVVISCLSLNSRKNGYCVYYASLVSDS
jgi:hypothetical protein